MRLLENGILILGVGKVTRDRSLRCIRVLVLSLFLGLSLLASCRRFDNGFRKSIGSSLEVGSEG